MKCVSPLASLIPQTAIAEPALLQDVPDYWNITHQPVFAEARRERLHFMACPNYLGVTDNPYHRWYLWPAKTRIARSPTPPHPSQTTGTIHQHVRAFWGPHRFMDYQGVLDRRNLVQHKLELQIPKTDVTLLHKEPFEAIRQHRALYGALFYVMDPALDTTRSPLSPEARALLIKVRQWYHKSRIKIPLNNEMVRTYEETFKVLRQEIDKFFATDPGSAFHVNLTLAICLQEYIDFMIHVGINDSKVAEKLLREIQKYLRAYSFSSTPLGNYWKTGIDARLRNCSLMP